MPSKHRSSYSWVLFPVLAASLAANAYFVTSAGRPRPHEQARTADGSTEEFPFLAKRIFIATPNAPLINFVPLRSQLLGYGDAQENDIGIYFQYLPTGIGVGYNEDAPFISASLLKVPTVMKVLKLIEEGKVNRDRKLTITEEVIDRGYGELWKMGIGAQVTVDQAMSASLISSDNTAHRLLYLLSEGRPSDVYDYLDMPVETMAGEAAISPRSYTSIFRSLFFSAYLSPDLSNEVLERLSQSLEGEVFRGDIPADVRIAQKGGVRAVRGPNNEKLEVRSYCGLFYVPQRPYVLCVMALGNERLARMQAHDVSDMVYRFVSSR